MRRTQLYLDDQLWNLLHIRAKAEKTTISELVREAIRGRYIGNQDRRMKAMQAFVGIRRGSDEDMDAVAYIESLRKDNRLERLYKK